jgi:hypothetical protein
MGLFKDLRNARKEAKALQEELTGGTSSFGMLRELVSEAPAMLHQAGEQLHGLQEGQAEGDRIRSTGVSGRATIAAVRDTGMTIGLGGMDNPVAELDLDVTVDGTPPYRLTQRQMVPRLQIGRLVPGATVPVKVDPVDHDKVVVLWE